MNDDKELAVPLEAGGNMTTRRDYLFQVLIENATFDEAATVHGEIVGAIEDARDSAVWEAPVNVAWDDPLVPAASAGRSNTLFYLNERRKTAPDGAQWDAFNRVIKLLQEEA